MGEPNQSKKVPLDEMSREDLIKKCKSLILLAQKAKLAKDEALNEILQYQTSIKGLEERCQEAECMSKKESQKVEKVTEQLVATQELLAAQQKLCTETEALVEERVTALTASSKAENAELLSELNVMNQVLKQRGELISKMEACHSEYESQIKQLEESLNHSTNVLKSKNEELETVISQQQQKIVDLEKEVSDLEESRKSENTLKKTISLQSEKISDFEREILSSKTVIEELEAQLETQKTVTSERVVKMAELSNQLKSEIERKEEIEKKMADLEKETSRELRDTESALKNTIALQTEKISELEGKLSSSATVVHDLEAQIEILKTTVLDRDETNDDLSNRLKSVTESNEDMKKKLSDFEKEVSVLLELKQSENTLKNTVSVQSEEITKLEENILSLKNVVQDYESQVETYKTVTSEKDMKIDEISSQLKSEIQRREEIEMKSADLQAVVDERSHVIENLKCSQTGEEKLADQISSLTNELHSLSKIKDDLESVLNLTKTKLASTEAELSEMKEKLESDGVERDEGNKKIEKLENNLKELLLEKENFIEQLTQKEEQLKKSQEILDDIQNKMESKVSALERARELMQSELQERLEKLEKDKENLIEELELSRLQIQSEQDEKLILERKVEKLRETISALETSLTNRDELLRSSEEAVNELTAQLDMNVKEGSSVSAELEKTAALLLEAQSKLSKYQDEMDGRIHTQLEDAAASIQALQEELQKEKDLTEKLTQQVSDLEKRLEQTSVHASETQKLLDERTASLADAEKELSKNRDHQGASEVANTEVSSNLSISRTEEAARLRDVEDSFEDKYTKLRIVAAKLKRRANDLNQTLESERAKFSKDLAEQQEKVVLLTSQLKTTHTLQAECDRLQDKLDAQQSELKDLQKNLESAVTEAANAKVQLVETREAATKAASEKKKLEGEYQELKARMVILESTNSDIAAAQRELRQTEKKLEQSKEEAVKLASDLEAARADAKKKSVLSLEMADYEKSVADLTQQLTNERQLTKSLEDQLSDERKLASQLQERVGKEEAQTKKLTDQISSMKEHLTTVGLDCEKKQSEIKELSCKLEKAVAEVESLQLQCSELGAQLSRERTASRSQIDALTSQVFQLEEQCSQARERAVISEEELASLKVDFESYKVRAQSVLRQSARNQEEIHSTSPRAAEEFEELEQELERLRLSLEVSRANLQTTSSQLQSVQQDLYTEREDKARLSRTIISLRDALTTATERQRAAEEALAITTDDLRQAKLNSDMLVQCYKQQLEDTNASHQKALSLMSEELEALRSSVQEGQESPNAAVLGGTAAVPNEHTRMATIHREEGEGSESVESYSARRLSVISQDLRPDIMPLDKLLSSSFPDDHGLNHMASAELVATREQLAACESRVAHLTALLSEVESDAARISQLNSVLKEEIRRQQRSEERTELAHNLEYLKNVVLKFVTLQNEDERARLVPVLNTILKLSPEEVAKLSSAAKGRESAASGWTSYLAGWSG